ncbi:MAG: site-specific DNA-methyltransferase [Chloroflexota bacterium]|nr:site-specific DNA-methyltransferase [Chloroflexota bacterium]MEC9451377.1 site-specific DNA-methyltransferase [Chloroflexota bacterium]
MNLYWKNKPEKIDPSLLSDKKIVDKLNVYPNQKTKNILIRSDNKVGISSLINSNAINEINASGGIKLIYIDPPYFTEKSQLMKKTKKEIIAYKDIYNHSLEEYLNEIYIQIKLLYSLLSDDGSIYVHVDYRTSSYIRIILDEIFGYKNLRGYLIWNIDNGAKSKKFWSNQHNDILVYSKSNKFIFNSSSKLLKTDFSESSLKTHFRKKDSEGRAYRERKINSKSYKYYAEDGKLVGSVWNDIKSMEANSPLMKEYTTYPTQKPISLLSRIISASSKKGDFILDTYCGSGTSLITANNLNRNWIGIDQSENAIKITKSRLDNNYYEII